VGRRTRYPSRHPPAGERQPYAIAFNGDGSRLAAATSVGALEVWDLDRRELVAPAIPIDGTQDPIGFTADGMIVTAGLSQAGGGTLTLWDPAGGRTSGTIRLDRGENDEAEIVDGRWLDVEGGVAFTASSSSALPFALALTPQQWADELCRVSRHPFTDVERAALPSGSTIDPPC
jgi:WD40 repeat protein